MKKVVEKYGKAASNYDDIYERHFDQMWHGILEKDIKISEDDHILDLGCGTGRIFHRIISKYEQHKLHLHGVDFCPEMVEETRKRLLEKAKDFHKIQLECADCMEYLKKHQCEEYDLIIASFLLGYVDLKKLFPLIFGALKEKGCFIIISSSKEHFMEIQNFFFKYIKAHAYYFNWLKILREKLTYLPTIGEIVKLFYELNFNKVETELVKNRVAFSDPLSWLKWMDETGLVTQFFGLARKGKKNRMLHKLVEYGEEKNFSFMGVPTQKGKPFNFAWPVYKIIAHK